MAATVEEVVVRASLRDDASRGVRKLKTELADTAVEAKALGGGPVNSALGRLMGGLRGAASAGDGLDKTLTRASSNVGSMFVTGVRRGALAVGALAGAMGLLGVKTNSSMQQSQMAFGVLLGNEQAGIDLYKQLQAINLKSPFDMASLSTATQMLLNMGVASEHVLPTLKALNDVAALTDNPTENLTRMALALGQINNAGVLRAQDLNQLVQAGFPAYQLLQDITGKTAAQIRKEMESGLELPASEFVAGVEQRIGVLQKYAGGAEKLNKTVAGQWSTFVDQLKQDLGSAASPLAQSLAKELPKASTMLERFINQVGPEMFAGFGQLVDQLVDKGPQLLSAFSTGLKTFADLAPRALDLLVAIAPAASDVAHAVGAIAAPVATVTTALLGFGPTRAIIEGVLVSLMAYKGLKAVTAVVEGLARSIWSVAAAEEAEAAASKGSALTSLAGGKARKAGKALGGVGKAAGAIAGGVVAVDGVKSAADDGFSFSGLFNSTLGTAGAGAAVGSIVPGVGTAWGAAGGAVLGAANYGLGLLFHDQHKEQQAGKTVNQHIGQVVINNPSSDVDVARAMQLQALERLDR